MTNPNFPEYQPDGDATKKPSRDKTRTPHNEDTESFEARRTRNLRQRVGTGHVQPVQPEQPQTPPTPTITGTGAQAPVGYSKRPTRRNPRANKRKEGALFLPWWSIALMLFAVLIVSSGLIGIVYLMGNTRSFLQEPTPIIRIITAQPTLVQQQVSQPTAFAPATQIITGNTAPQQLALSGPTLAPVILTPTPAAIVIGSRIVVDGVDAQTLNVRDIGSIRESVVLFRAEEGEFFNISAGPQQADGFTWWQIQDPNDPTRIGWAVSNYLRVVAPE